jgi:succinate dehydrogenase / fumarate reductase cytochrome b subunit
MKTSNLWWSSVGKKLLNGLSGLMLIGFVCVHLAGNLTLFARDGGKLFNSYAHHLESLGPLLYAMEFGLIAVFLLHIASAVSVRLSQKEARPQAYAVAASKGGPSRQSLSSRSMLITGLLLAGFVVLHVKMFKFNGGTTPHAEVAWQGGARPLQAGGRGRSQNPGGDLGLYT